MAHQSKLPTVWHGEEALSRVRDITSELELCRLLSSSLRERETGSLQKSIKVLGMEACQELLVATIHQENEGGLLRTDGRRRTPGGTFFELLRQVASKAQYREIFLEKTRAKNSTRNAKKRLFMKLD